MICANKKYYSIFYIFLNELLFYNWTSKWKRRSL